MNKTGILKYLTNNHLTYDELVDNYNKLLKDNSLLENKYKIKCSECIEIKDELNNIKNNIKEIKKDRSNIEIVFIKYYDRIYNYITNMKPSMNNILNILDEIKEKISDNHYLESMNILKKMFDETNSFNLINDSNSDSDSESSDYNLNDIINASDSDSDSESSDYNFTI